MKRINTMIFCLIIGIMMILNILLPDQSISISERRHLKTFPEFTTEGLFTGRFMEELEPYLLDQFAFREGFRHIKSIIEFDVFNKKDVNDIFEEDGHLMKLEYPYDQEMVEHMVAYMNLISQTYLKDNKVYYSIIPDKGYYMDTDFLKLDYEDMRNRLISGLDDMTYIDLFGTLSLDDYYCTDPHWRQEKLGGVIEKLSAEMGFALAHQIEDYERISYEHFYGAYSGQSSLSMDAERLQYLMLDTFENVSVINYEKPGEACSLYNTSKLMGIDPYDVFLSGASPLLEVINPYADTKKELIIFRDSFASSLTPLLISSYSKITLIDTRYIGYEYLDEFVDFNTQDVMFLYSTLVINKSVMLK